MKYRAILCPFHTKNGMDGIFRGLSRKRKMVDEDEDEYAELFNTPIKKLLQF